jgi:hypothetical protein
LAGALVDAGKRQRKELREKAKLPWNTKKRKQNPLVRFRNQSRVAARRSKTQHNALRVRHPGRSTNELLITSGTDTTRSFKRCQEEGLKLDTMRKIKRRKTAVAKEFRRLAERLEVNNAEDSMVDAAINELTKDMSRNELIESFKALMEESDEWTTEMKNMSSRVGAESFGGQLVVSKIHAPLYAFI